MAYDGLFIQKLEVISLRTSGKRLPGKTLAVYIGAVIAVLVLSYNLARDLPFILISDKEGIIFTLSFQHFMDSINVFLERSVLSSEMVLPIVSI